MQTETVLGQCAGIVSSVGTGGQILKGAGRRKSLAPPPGPRWIPEAPPPSSRSHAQLLQDGSVPLPHQALCLLLPTFFPSFRVSRGASSPDPWMELARGFFVPHCPCTCFFRRSLPVQWTGLFPTDWRFPGLVLGTGRAASLQSPHSPKDVQRLSQPQHPLGSRDHPQSQGP